MTRSRYLILCALVLTGPVAYAQERIGPANVRGTAFTLVNQQGQTEGTLRSGVMGAELELNDANGKPRVQIGVTGITILDGMGRRIWTSPKGMGILPATTE